MDFQMHAATDKTRQRATAEFEYFASTTDSSVLEIIMDITDTFVRATIQ